MVHFGQIMSGQCCYSSLSHLRTASFCVVISESVTEIFQSSQMQHVVKYNVCDWLYKSHQSDPPFKAIQNLESRLFDNKVLDLVLGGSRVSEEALKPSVGSRLARFDHPKAAQHVNHHLPNSAPGIFHKCSACDASPA